MIVRTDIMQVNLAIINFELLNLLNTIKKKREQFCKMKDNF